MVSLACVVRRHIAHYRGELLVLRKKESVARSLGDAALAERLKQDITRARGSFLALESALGDWVCTNAGQLRRNLEETAEGSDS